ncbi:hypothetical protein BDV18DRAFT_134306 [Aspergillus unguis]
MASCILTLGPLWEMLRGERSWSSRNGSYNYKRSGNKLPSTGDQYVKKSALSSVRDKDADLFTT